MLGQVALAVRVGGQVGAVDGDVRPHLRVCNVGRGGHAVKAGGEQIAVGPEFGREAVAGVYGRHVVCVPPGTGDGCPQSGVFPDESHGTRPRRHGVQALGERHPDHAADRVAGTPRPARRLKLGNQRPNLGRVKQGPDLSGVGGPWYLGRGHRGAIPLVQSPGGSRLAGLIFYSS